MNSAPIEFHKIWIDQCAATENIREHFGLQNALGYLISEKLLFFLHAAERDPLFAAETPAFVQEIKQLFTVEEIRDYLNHLEETKYLAPPEPDMEIDDEDDPEKEDPWPDTVLLGFFLAPSGTPDCKSHEPNRPIPRWPCRWALHGRSPAVPVPAGYRQVNYGRRP